jgi:hypothetical protein
MPRALGSRAWEGTRMDAVFLVLAIGFFALSCLFVRLCQRL